MKRSFLLSIVIAAFIFAGCSSSKEPTGVWINKEKIQGKSFTNVFIIAMTADIQARVRVEGDLAAGAIARGYKAIKSIDVMPPKLSDPKMPEKEEIIAKVKESECDAIFVATLLKQEEAVHYTPGHTAYSVMPNYSYYGTFFGYYSNWYPTVSTPGYYSKEKNYFMESNLYDAASQEIMWSVQSEIFDPSSLGRFSKSYTNTLVKQLEQAKLLKH